MNATILLARLLDVQSEAFREKLKLTYHPYTEEELRAGETVEPVSNIVKWDSRK